MNNDDFKEEDEFRGLGSEIFIPHEKKVYLLEDKNTPILSGKKTEIQKAIRVMIKRSGLSRCPNSLFDCFGTVVPLAEIGFISEDDPKETLVSELAKMFTVRNRLNREEVSKKRILSVGTEILKAGHMWTPIHVCKISEDGRYECVSGRHRLAFLAILYGVDLKVPVHLDVLSLQDARRAVAVANDGRPARAMERASYAILKAVVGNSKEKQNMLFDSLSDCKNGILKYCVYNVLEKGYPNKLDFKTSEQSSRPDGSLITVSNVERFWDEGLIWHKEMTQKEFDKRLFDSVNFLNCFVRDIKEKEGFDPEQHLTANVMSALGRYYQTYLNVTGKNAVLNVKQLSDCIVSIGKTKGMAMMDLYIAISASNS